MNEQSDQFALIDRLAAGDLDGPARRDLFTWLDCEPARWRRCALALLEARELERAFDDWQAEVPRSATAALVPAVERSRRSPIFALAASILIAVSLGVVARGLWVAAGPIIVELPKSADREAPAATPRKSPPEVVKETDSTSHKGVTTVAAAPPSAAQTDRIPAYVRSQWERRGYQLTSRPTRLPVILPDGRRLMVPVDEFQLNYVGQRTY